MSDEEEVVLSSDAEEVIMLLGEFQDNGIDATDDAIGDILEWSIDRVKFALIELADKGLITQENMSKVN